MAKLILNNITSGFASNNLLNANNTAIEAAMENTLSRDGTGPNQMNAPLDMNGNMILNQANPITVNGFNWKGPWVTGSTYNVGDVTQSNNSSYICIVQHTAGASFATDLAAGKWQVVASSAALPSQTGNAGKILSTDGSSANWAAVNTLALPIGGGTLTGALNGTSGAFSGALSGASGSFNSLTTTGNITIGGTSAFSGPVSISSTLGITGALTPSGGIVGVNTNSVASSGQVGEVIRGSVSSGTPVSLTTGTNTNLVSIVLTAGDWDVYGNVLFTYATNTQLYYIASSMNSVSATMSSNARTGQAFPPSGQVMGTLQPTGGGYLISEVKVPNGSTVTMYLIAYSVFSISTCSAFGEIWARRVR